jgi:molybdate transport system substrate-binding protein
MKQTRIVAAAVALAVTLAATIAANAAEITVISSNALKSVMEQLAPAFEKATEHKLKLVWGAAVPLQAQIEKGAAFDLAILPTAAIDDLARQGKLVGGSRAALASSGAGVAVRKGAPKPDISTVEAFKATLLGAKSIAYSDSGSGTYLSTKLFPQMGIADQIAGKSRKVRGPPSGEPVAAVVARGESEIGFQQVSELIHVPGITYVGAIPDSLQPGFSFAGSVTTNAKAPEAAAELLRYLSSTQAAATITKAGLTPIQ